VIARDEIVVDLFAGGGGASDGIEIALGRPVTLAVNHSRTAIECHQRNHPHTHHEIADVWEVDPAEACAGRPVGLLWASPSCTHYSRAKGGHNPKSAEIRSLPWVIVRWARAVKPRMIFMENVPEFLDWGPLDNNGHPIKSKRGRTFRIWLGKLKAQGYTVEWRQLVAADYGAPTTRKRVYLIARRDGQPIAWPEPTHSRAPSLFASPWRTAAECIDWSLPARSIFDRKKPLAEKTLKRIAAGIVRYVLRSAKPFVVSLTHHGGDRVHGMDSPLPTVTAANRGELALVAPTLVSHYGQSVGRALTEPAPTITAGGQGHAALVAASLVKYYGTSSAADATAPLPTVTAGAGGGHLGLVAASLVQTGYGECEGQQPRAMDVRQPLGTVVAGGQKHALCAALLTKHFGGVVGQEINAPASTITATDHHALTTAALDGVPDRREQVRAFLITYYGADGKPETQKQSLDAPLGTVTTRDRFALVTVNGVEHEITDIATRMLAPRELFRAQGFRVTYDLSGLTKTQQIALCGNSVCPPVAEALVRANAASANAQRGAA
jgi:DNA (cytosine-5)-methyltransferase 1